ncbi:MAG: hypothetical protein WCD18_16560, partial [Thermosynechococcaceae cyanobacterium]
GAEFPAQLLENPIFSLLLLEHINFVEEIPIQTLRSLLKQKSVPVYLLELAVDRADVDVQLALAMNVQTSEGVLRRLTQSRHEPVVQAARLHVNLAGELPANGYAEKAKRMIQETLPDPFFVRTASTELPALAQICPIPDAIVDRWVSQPRYQSLCRAIAPSSATSPDILRKLIHHKESQEELAKNLNAPAEVLRELSNIPLCAYELARHPHAPVDVLEKLCDFPNSIVHQRIAQNPNTPLSILNELLENGDAETGKIAFNRLMVLKEENPTQVFQKSKRLSLIEGFDTIPILKHSQGTRRFAAQCMNTPIPILEALAEDTDWVVLGAIGAHPNTPMPILEAFAKGNDISARRGVARNPSTPINLLEILAKDQSVEVRKGVVENPNTPIEMLEKLAYDDESSIRWDVAHSPRISLNILFKELARDAWVSHCIAYQIAAQYQNSHPTEKILDILAQESTSPLETILQRLIQEGSSSARRFLASRWDIPVEILVQLVNDFRQSEVPVYEIVAQHPNTPASTLAQLANAPEVKLRERVSRHPNTAIATLEQLANDEIASVRLNIAERTDISSHVVEVLADDRDPTVRAKAMANPNFPEDAVEAMLCGEYAAEYLQQNPYCLAQNPEILAKILNHYAQSSSLETSFIVLRQPQIDPEQLQKKSCSTQWLERFAVAQNPQTPCAILQQLAEDANQLVRAAAKDPLQQSIA